MSLILFSSQYSTVQCSAVFRRCVVAFNLHYSLEHLTCCYSMSVTLFSSQYSTVQYSTVQYSTVLYAYYVLCLPVCITVWNI